MKRKVITKDFIGILKTINIIPMFIFIWENPLSVWQAGWMLFMFFLEVVYLFYALRIVLLPHDKTKHLELDKRTENFYAISIMLSLVSTFVAAGGMTSGNLAIKYTLIPIWATLVVVWLASQFIIDRTIMKTELSNIDDIDFTKLTNKRLECTNSELENVSVCLFALIVMSFLMFALMFAIIFVEILNIALWIYIPGVVLSGLFLLIVFYFTYKFTKQFKNKMIIIFLIYLVVQIVEGVFIYLVQSGFDLSDDVRRGVVFGSYFACFICLWIILMVPLFKHLRAMHAYLQENKEQESFIEYDNDNQYNS